MEEQRQQTPQQPDFGPSGYLPARAAARARKIVLRSPLGLQWVIASLLAGALIVVAGTLFLQRSGAAPGEPWVAVAEVATLDATEHIERLDVTVVSVGGRPAAFIDAAQLTYCPASGRLESPDGGVWSLTGRGLGGSPSLTTRPTRIHEGTLYLDPTRALDAPAATDDPVEPGCT